MLTADEAKRLREAVLVAPSMGDYFEIPEDCRDGLHALLALHDAVMAAPVGEARGSQQSWQAGGCTDITVRFLDINADIPLLRKYRLVPDCGPTAEAKEGV